MSIISMNTLQINGTQEYEICYGDIYRIYHEHSFFEISVDFLIFLISYRIVKNRFSDQEFIFSWQ